ncbi:MAG: tetratricopeptide repeat protein [Opitutales bacterium]
MPSPANRAPLSPAASIRAAAERHFHAGNSHREAGRSAEALADYREALALCPDLGEAEFNIGILREKDGALVEALASYRRAANFLSGRAEVHFAIGNACFKLHRFEEAVGAYRTALAIRPDFPPAWLNLGNTFRLRNDLAGAFECYQRVAALQPDLADAHVNLANAYRAQNRLPEARAACERALALAPQLPEAHLNYAMTLLVGGDLRAAWPHAEYRHAWKLGGAGREFTQPGWKGDAPLAGRRILLHGEQGLGDTLQFIRYVRQVTELGAIVHVEVQPPLRDLVAASLPKAASVRAYGEPLPEFDLHCPLASLPRAFGTELATIPVRVPYLRAPADRVERWRRFFGATPGWRIGFAWAGNPTHPNDYNRSLPLAEFQRVCAPLAGAGFCNLKKEMSAADAALLTGLPGVVDPAPQLGDLADTAALIEQLDLVIAVDTSVAHLAGALGRPVWIMLPFSPDWRWLLEREDSPWYPTARLFRQPRIDDWGSVLTRVRSELERFCALRR